MTKTDIILMVSNAKLLTKNIRSLTTTNRIKQVVIIGASPIEESLPENCVYIETIHPYSFKTLRDAMGYCTSSNVAFVKSAPFRTGVQKGIIDMVEIMNATNSQMVYGNYTVLGEQTQYVYPLIQAQPGSIRDDFNFGYVQCFSTQSIKTYLNDCGNDELNFSALYALHLFTLRSGKALHIPQPCYTVFDKENKENTHFKYLEASQEEIQKEMEIVCTQHLDAINARVKPPFKEIIPDEEFSTVASVIIPVKNREKTIKDAVKSALKQKTNFSFNVIVVDNFSTDNTTKYLQKLDKKIIHHIPRRKDLGIGGCWNEALIHPACGTFAVQLDSDDLYKDAHTLQTIVDTFREEKCAMVIGAYSLVDFKLKPIPPGLIDHREWTPDNGANNALRINGFGAPRAFYAPLARKIGFPNTSYGEDYAMALRIASEYKVGRIYDSLYLCRRWQDNSDASLSMEKKNTYNIYKDWIRTCEIMRRQNSKEHA